MSLTPQERLDLDEAIAIARGGSLLLPEPRHCRALNDSRIYWREAAMTRHRVPMPPPQALRQQQDIVDRVNRVFNWADRLSDTQHAVLVTVMALVAFAGASACFAGFVQGVRLVLR